MNLNLDPKLLRQLATLVEQIQGTAKPHAAPVVKRKASAPKAKPTPVIAKASKPPTESDEQRKAKVRVWAKARRARKRAEREAAAKAALVKPDADVVARSKKFTAANLAQASKVATQTCRDLQCGRLLPADVIAKIQAGLDLLSEAVGS